MSPYRLSTYIIATAVVWAVLLAASAYWGSLAHTHTMLLVCAGFYIGMLAMYIAVHVYRS